MVVSEHTTIHTTHEVVNQPPFLRDYNLYDSDLPLREALARENADWAAERVGAFGAQLGSAEFIEHGRLANEFPPRFQTHDRFGHRIDEVEFHPAYHALMAAGKAAEVHALPWNHPRPGAHAARAALHFMLDQTEAGVCCPLTMTFACIPTLRMQPDVASEWEPRATSPEYDARNMPAPEKRGCTLGMALTEKQGGSDVRANTTRAEPVGLAGPGAEYLLTGHKFFVSAPMSDAFLTTAHTENGVSCFLMPRWLPDGTLNRFRIQRIKDKLGNRSNATSEMEYTEAWARMVGGEGNGIKTIVEMINHTRLDCLIGSAGLMRQALVQALHHARHRQAFDRRLCEQPLQRNVLTDLALESEAATALMMRLAGIYDETMHDTTRVPLRRLCTALFKYWVCKRAPAMVYEAMECQGGDGVMEPSPMPRLYREAVINPIWEGSSNIMCLDVLRTMLKAPEAVPMFLDELAAACGVDSRYDAHVKDLKQRLFERRSAELRARRVVGDMALAFQAALLIRHAPDYVADAFCTARLDGQAGSEYGTLPQGLEFGAIIDRATPQVG